MERVDGTPRFRARLVDRHWLAPGILELRLTRPEGVTFIPGQFLRFVMDGYERDYTMVSAPDAETLDFCIAMVDGGRFSSDIQKADIACHISVDRAPRSFRLPGPGESGGVRGHGNRRCPLCGLLPERGGRRPPASWRGHT